MRHIAIRFRQDSSGAAATLLSLFLPVGLAAVGATIVYTQSSKVHTDQQKALDAAVLAGAALPVGSADAARIKAAQDTFNGGLSANTRSAAPAISADFTVEAVGSDNVKVTGKATAAVTNAFAGLIGGSTVPIVNTAAAVKGSSAPVCVYALNNNANGAVDLNGTVNVASSCPVQANSDDSSAVRAVGNAQMTTTVFNVAGNTKGKEAFSPAPAPNSPRLPDPFASVPFPAVSSCSPLSNTILKSSASIGPGTYCGGLRVSSGAVVRLEPGIYIFKDGDFKIDSGSQVTGEEVMLAFDGKGAKFWMTGGAVMSVTSPKSGAYMNMQFMENRSSTTRNTWVSIGGDSKLTYDGTMYFPLSNVWIFGGSIVKGSSPNVVMIGDKLWFQDNSTITLTQENRRDLAVADTPRLKSGAILTQ